MRAQLLTSLAVAPAPSAAAPGPDRPGLCLPAGWSLAAYDTIDSTNAEARRRAEAGAPHGTVVQARAQSAGRGRYRRPWVSEAGNLYCSVVLRPDCPAAQAGQLSFLVALAGAAAVEELAPACRVQLKWPNDLLAGNDKFGGVLIEMSGDADGPCRAVVGMGLNVCMPAEAAAVIDQPWTDLAALAGGAPPSRSLLLATVLGRVLPLLAGYGGAGFAPWQARWEALDAFAGAPVQVLAGETRLAGTARGVDERGALRLETPTGLRPIHGGEVSLRRRP